MSLQAVPDFPAQTPSLDERRTRIYDLLGKAALEIGAELLAAKEDHPLSFTAWVNAEMPWGLDTAERFMSISRAFADATPEVLAALPKPWTTLFELSRLNPARLHNAIEAGVVTPKTTHVEAKKLTAADGDSDPAATPAPKVLAQTPDRIPEQDILVLGLLKYHPGDLDPRLLDRLKGWVL